jgi:hypothetical protein
MEIKNNFYFATIFAPSIDCASRTILTACSGFFKKSS